LAISECNDLNLFLNHIRKVHLLDKVNNLIEARVDEPAIIPYGADPDLGPLPEVVIPHLRDGNIEPVPDAVDQFSENMTLFLQRMIFRNPKVELTNAYHHLPPQAPLQ
jgi:hypothetical protein